MSEVEECCVGYDEPCGRPAMYWLMTLFAGADGESRMEQLGYCSECYQRIQEDAERGKPLDPDALIW